MSNYNDAMMYILSAPKGLGQFAVREAQEKFGPAADNFRVRSTRNFDLISLDYTGSPADLLKLRMIEDVWVWLATVKLSGAPSDLRAIGSAVKSAELNRAAGLLAAKPRHGATFRVVAQATDEHWRQYRRVDMAAALEQSIGRLPHWRPGGESAWAEIWLHQIGHEAVISLRLSSITLRQRDYKRTSLPASLRPAVAAAMVQLSEPGPDDIVLDPMCGAGTILLERALAGRYQLLLGGDIRPEAVAATRDNFGVRHKPWHIQQWDVRRLPLDDASVTKIITNPPWGRQLSRPSEIGPLYRDMMAEFVRVLQPGGRLVILTSEREILLIQLARYPRLKFIKRYLHIGVLGQSADILVVNRI
jgi:tRNA (guanine6-N2)-methyltransferase